MRRADGKSPQTLAVMSWQVRARGSFRGYCDCSCVRGCEGYGVAPFLDRMPHFPNGPEREPGSGTRHTIEENSH